MAKNRFRLWLELLAVVIGIACVLAVFFVTVGSANNSTNDGESDPAVSSQPAQAPSATQTYEGVITDTKCGAKHSPVIAANAADCSRICVHAGEHFALVDGDKVYVLEGEPELLKRVAGQRVTVAGTLNGNIISVNSVREGIH